MAILDPDSGRRMPLERDLNEKYAAEAGSWRAAGCKCEQTELRRGFNSGGGPIVRNQCLDCGRLLGNPVKRTPETDLLNEIDRELEPAYNTRRKGEHDAIARRYVKLQQSRWRGSAKGKTYFQQSHQAYLTSSEWRDRKQLVMDRANGLCEGCRRSRPTEVHHLTYRNWGKEFLFELVALCGDCHDRVHRLDIDRATGCIDCVHAGDEAEWCLLFGMPTGAALTPGGACGTEREGFESKDEYG